MFKPFFQCILISAFKNRNGFMSFLINNYRSIGLSLCKCKVINAYRRTAYLLGLSFISSYQKPNDAVGADGDIHRFAYSWTALTACFKCDSADQIGKSFGFSGVMIQKSIDSFRKRNDFAIGVFTVVFICFYLQSNSFPHHRQILNLSDICTMIPCADNAAARTDPLLCPRL